MGDDRREHRHRRQLAYEVEQIADAPTVQINYTKWLEQLRVDLAQSVGGIMLRGALVVPVGSSAGARRGRVSTGPGALVGWALRNTDAANPATVELFDGTDADTGSLVAPIELAAGESPPPTWFGPGGLNIARGLFLNVAAGAVDGAVYLRGAD